MNLRQIEIFCAVMRGRTTIAAAYELGISQPAISNAIKHFEAQVGMQLFERTGNRLVPTVEAIALYRDAEPLHAMSQSIARKVQDLRDTRRGHFRIMATHALMRSMAAATLSDFLRTRDSVQVFFDVRRMEGVLESVESGFADLGLALAPPPRPGIAVQVIASGTMVAILPLGHPLAAYDVLGPAELEGHSLIGLEPASRLGSLVRQYFDETGNSYMPNIEVRHCTTACMLVEQGLGVSIVDSFSADPRNNWNFEVRPFIPEITVPACAIHLKERPLSRLAGRFIQILRSKTTVKSIDVKESRNRGFPNLDSRSAQLRLRSAGRRTPAD